MAITAGEDILASDFVSASSGASDSGKVPKLTATGKMHSSFLRFGGDGSDGALNVTSGTTTLDIGNSALKVFNFTSINISAGATVDFENPHAGGSVVVIKSQNGIVIAGTLDFTGTGASDSQTANFQITSTSHLGVSGLVGAVGGAGSNGADGANGTAGSQLDFLERYMLVDDVSKLEKKSYYFQTACGNTAPTNGGAGGNGPGGLGGAGGAKGVNGASSSLLIIECGGSWDFTGTIDCSGDDGTDGSDGSDGGSNALEAGGGGGGGGGGGNGGQGGFCLVIYDELVANTGTINTAGGDAGDGGDGGDGGAGRVSGSNGGTAGAGGGGGGAGSTPGTKSDTGVAGLGGKGGVKSDNVNNGAGGAGGSGGCGGCGGGTFFGGKGTQGTRASFGAVGSASRPSPGGAGSSGGIGGTGATSIGGLVVQNQWFT